MVLLVDLVDEREQLVHALTGLRRDEQHGRVGHIRQALTHAERILLHGGAVLLDEIPFVDDDDARLACVMRLAGNLGVLLGDALGRVDHDDADVRTLDREQRAHDRELLDFLVHLALLADAGGVDKGELAARIVHVGVYAVARRAGNVRNDNTLLAQHTVEQAGLADVRLADEGNTDAVGVLFLLVCRREVLVGCVKQLTYTVAVQSGNAERLAQTEVVELVKFRRGIARLDSQHERLARAQQHGRNVLVGGGNARAQVGDEDDNIRVRNRRFRLKAHELQDFVIVGRLDAAGVDYGEVAAAPVAVRVQAVTGNTRRVLDDGQALACQTVEKLRFADVRTAHDRNDRFCHRFSLPQVQFTSFSQTAQFNLHRFHRKTQFLT